MRDFAAFCTLMACLIVFVASIIAIVHPLPKVGLGTRKRALSGFGVAVGLFVLTAIIIPPPSEEKAAAKEAKALSEPAPEHVEKAKAPQAPQKPSLGIDVEEFADTFNALAVKADKPWRISNVTMKGNAFSYMLNDRIGLVGTVRSDKELTGVVMMAGGDGTLGSGVDVFMVMSMTYCAAAGISDLKQCGGPIMPLMKNFEEGDEPLKTTINNIELSYSRSEQLGNMFSISPVS